MLEQLLKQPGFIYEMNGKYFFMGKWICKECTDVSACDCVFMYQMCRRSKEEPDTNMYFQRIRAYSDFALDIPYNAAKIREDMAELLQGLSKNESKMLEKQIQNFIEDNDKYCG